MDLRAALACVLLGGCTATTAPPQRFEYRRTMMGSEARIVVHAESEDRARTAAAAAFARIAELDAVMSDYRADSEVTRLCTQSGGIAVPVSDDLFLVLQRSAEVSEATDGAFDVTVGPVVRLWREARRDVQLPEPDALERARVAVGWRYVDLQTPPLGAPTVTLVRPGMQLDFGGIGKGFAADEALAVLAQHGLNQCLVDLGGDIVVGDAPPGRSAWQIDVDTGLGEDPPTFELVRAGVATSGDREQFVVIDGQRYSHIIDPRSGMALSDRIAVVVIAHDATTADALASALSVLGRDGLERLDRFPGTQAWVNQGTEAARR